MRKVKWILGLGALALIFNVSWQLSACEIVNAELRDDLVDLAAQGGVRIGLKPPSTDESLRAAILQKAQGYGITLQPDQVTVRHIHGIPNIYLAVDYEQRVGLPGFWYVLHFSPSSQRAEDLD
jgi:hypothetical protein